MRRSGLLVWEILQKLAAMVRWGVTTQDLEVAAEKMMTDAGAKPAFKGYYVPSAGTKYPFVSVHFGERRDRARDAVGEEGVEGGRYRLDRHRRVVERILTAIRPSRCRLARSVASLRSCWR